MDPSPISRTLRTATAGLRFSCAMLLALAANFVWAGGHDQQRCIELVVLGLAFAVALASGAVPRAIQALPASGRRLCLVFLVLGVAASAGVVSPRHAWAEWAMFALLGLSAILVAAEITAAGTPGLVRLLQLLGLACAAYSLRVLLMYSAAMAARVQVDYHALAIGFSNARFLNHTQTALLPLLVLASRPSMRARVPAKVFFAAAAFWWSLIFVSEARATALALLTGAVVALALRRQLAKGWMMAMVASAAAGLLIYVFLYIALPAALGISPLGMPTNLVERSAADPASGRMFLWKLALGLIAEHPLLGAGPQHFAHFGHALYMAAHPHDWLLQIAVEWGIPACLCLVAILLLGARGLAGATSRIAAADGPQQDIATTLIVAVSAIVVDGLFSGVLVMPQSQIAIALVLGVAIGWVRSQGPATTTMPVLEPATRYIGTCVGVLSLVIMISFAGPDLGRKWQNAPLEAREQAQNQRGHWPRMWVAGYF
jgi:O-antigen ligase